MSQIAIHQLIRGSFLAGVLFVTLNAHAVVTVSGAGIADQLSDDGASVSVDIKSAFNGNPNTFALTSGALPDGLSLNGITGLITGTVNPSASEASPYSAEISASDGGTPVPDAFTWTVTNIAPLAVADKNGINEAGTTITGNVLANDADGAPDTDALIVGAINGGTVGAATAGTYGSLVLNSDGSYTYTIDNLNPVVQALDAGQTLLDILTYTADDNEGGTSDATLDITITGVDDAPLVGTPIANQAHTDGQAGISLDVSAAFTPSTDNGDTLVAFNLSSGTLPGGLALATSTGLITGTIDKSASQIDLGDGAGIYPLTITATDSDGLTVTDTFTWTVTNVAPLAVADTNGINEEGTTITGNVLANDADGAPDTDILMVSAINGGTVGAATAGTYGSLVLNSDGSYTYTIDNLNPMVQALDAGQTLLDTLTYTANDKEGGTSNATLDITITGVNDLPVVTGNFTGSVTEGNLGDTVTVSGAINITDVDTSNTPSFATNVTGTFGGIVVTPGGWTYTLDQNLVQDLDAGDVVTDKLILAATSLDPVTQAIVITITGSNDKPEISDQSINLPENSASAAFVLNLGATDIDVDDTTFSFVITAGLTAPAEFQVNSNGDLLVGTHTPDIELLNFETKNAYTLIVEVTDSQGLTDTATITVNLTDQNDAPGITVCEEFDSLGESRNTLPGFITPLLALGYYDFSAATPCHRVISTPVDYYMEQDKRIVTQSPIPALADTATTNYRQLISEFPYAWDQDDTRLYYSTLQSTTSLLATVAFTDEAGTDSTSGEFIYLPTAGKNLTDDGLDHFIYRVCDTPASTIEARCALGIVYVSILKRAADAVNTGNVADSGTLSQGPLELPIPALPNVFILLDDSEAMASDILTDQSEGYYAVGNLTKTWFLPEDGTGRPSYAVSEAKDSTSGLWRLRNKDYNKVYYNPEITYLPWVGLDNRGDNFTNSDPTAAISDPYTRNSRKINLTVGQDMPGSDSNVFLAKHYIWTDIDDAINCPDNVVGVVDGTSPFTAAGGICTEGTLVEIKPATSIYPKGPNRTDCVGINCTYAEEIQNFANFYSFGRTRHYTAKNALGGILAASENMRIGFGAFGGKDDNINITEMNESALTGHKGELLNRLYRNNASSNSTPIRDSLERTGRYYECENSNTIITSGRTCPVLPAPEGNCQQNFTLVVTAGFWNGNTNTLSTDDADGDDSSNWDGGRYADAGSTTPTLADIAMHFYERDLHPSLSNEVPATDNDLAGAAASAFGGSTLNRTMHQHMSTYVVAFGVEGSLSPTDVPTDYTTAFDWGDAVTDDEKLNDLLHTAVNGRGSYLDAGDPEELKSALKTAFSEFSQAIGTASAVSFNSQEVQQGALLYRAIYNVRENTGDLVAQGFNLDGSLGDQVWSAAEQLDLKDATATDPSINRRELLTYDNSVANGARGIAFRPQAIVENNQQLAEALEDDILGVLNWDNIFDPDASPSPDLFDRQMIKHVNYLRGDASNERPLGNLRERPVVKGRLGDIVSSTPVFYGPPNRARRTLPPYPTTAAQSYAAFKGSYTNLLADDDKERQPMVYVGSNDGFLHGFNGNTGEEHFAYMPGEVITGVYSQRIKQLLSTNYLHRYSVDLAAAVNDVYLDSDRRSDTGSIEKHWATVLIGGYRAGGKGYFALDISDPTGANDANKAITEANASKVVMWEFSPADDTPVTDYGIDTNADTLAAGDTDDRSVDALSQPISDLGYTFSTPTIAMSNVSETDLSPSTADRDNRWIAVLGNGYDSTSGNAVLFAVFVDGGTDGTWCHPEKPGCATDNGDGDSFDFVKITAAGRSSTGIANGLGVPRGIDLDGNGTLDIAYAGDRFGNLFRFDLRNPDPAKWHSTLLYSASYTDANGITLAQPITTQPLVIAHPTIKTGVDCGAFDANEVLASNLCGGYIVIFGTGSYIYEGDDTNKDIQSIYGIWDRLGTTKVTQDTLVEQTYTAFSGDANVGDGRVLSRNPVDYNSKFGWYLNFDNPAAVPVEIDGVNQAQFPGERAIRNIQLRGGIVFINSVIPKAELSCSVQAGGASNAFCPDTGSTFCITRDGIFDINGDSTIDAADKTTSGNLVASTYFEGSVPTDSTFFGDSLVTQLSDQSLNITLTDTSASVHTGRISWSQLTTD